jgi:carbonic anhydrase
LRTIIDQIIVAVRASDIGLQRLYGSKIAEHPGYRKALIQTTVALNAAWNAFNLRQEIASVGPRTKIVFGVYDLGSHGLGLVPESGVRRFRRGFFEPPKDADEFQKLGAELCAGARLDDAPKKVNRRPV